MIIVAAGAVIAATGGLLTGSPNGLSLFGVLIMVGGVVRLAVWELSRRA